MKVEIELTDEQMKHLTSNDVFRYMLALSAEQAEEMRSQLPKPEKRWRFYKCWIETENLDSSEKRNRENGNAYTYPYPIANSEVCYCFTREQLEDAFRWVFLRTHDQLAIISAELVNRFLSQQEVKD